jgi:excisionase family DNA binding protein
MEGGMSYVVAAVLLARCVMTTERSGNRLSRLLTVQELADLLQIPAKTIYTWRYKGFGPPAVPMGKYLRFRAEDVAAWLDERADVPPSRPGRRSQLGSRLAGGAG